MSTLRWMRGHAGTEEDRGIERRRAVQAAARSPFHLVGEDPSMALMHPEVTAHVRRAEKPAAGHPVLFALLLILAAAGMLGLLVMGPSLALPLALGSAAALMALVGIAWVVAGPRL